MAGNNTLFPVEPTSLENQRAYWGVSFVILSGAVISLVYLYLESRKNKAFKTPILQSLSILIIGDIVFTLAFFPYHAYNTINTLILGETFIDPGESPLCLTSWFFAALSLNIELWGFAYLGYLPYTMMKESSRMRVFSRRKGRFYYMVLGVSVATNCLWFFVGYADGEIGSQRGLYCGANTWDTFQGGFVFVLFSFAVSVFVVLFRLTYKEVKKMDRLVTVIPDQSSDSAMGNTSSHMLPSNGRTSGTRAILKFGMIMFANFCGTYSLYTLNTFWNTLSQQTGSYPPIELELVAAWIVKLKPAIDVITILQIPSVKKERAKRNRARTALQTDLTSNSMTSENRLRSSKF